MSPGTRRIAYAAVLTGVVLASLALRLPGLEDKPLHSDEGVNGWFTLRLYWWNVYRYQHSDYHGPFLYYVNLLFFHLLGPTDRALRMGTALAGSFAVLTLIPVRRWLGAVGTGVFGALMAAGPALVYFSRTNIHEAYLVAFTMLWVAALLRFAEAPSRRWGLVAAAAAFGCFANKETAILTTASLGLAAGVAWLVGKASTDPRDPDAFGGVDRWQALKSWTLEQKLTWVGGIALFAVLMVVLFSSFFTFFYGVGSFFRAFAPWLEYGTSGRNQGKPFGYFLTVMTASEGIALYAAFLPALWAVVRRHRVGLFLVTWAASTFLIYSLIPYKTPWCVLNIDLPVFLLCGWGAQQGWLQLSDGAASKALRAAGFLAIALPVAALPGLTAETLSVSSDGYDDHSHPYVYVQTTRGQMDMVSDLLGIGAVVADDGLGPRVVNVEAKNPHRWYTITRGWDHSRSTYIKKAPSAEQIRKADIVTATGKHTRNTARAVDASEGNWHKESYELRPGWRVSVWYRDAQWKAFQAAGGREAWAWPQPETAVHRPPKPKRYRRHKNDL